MRYKIHSLNEITEGENLKTLSNNLYARKRGKGINPWPVGYALYLLVGGGTSVWSEFSLGKASQPTQRLWFLFMSCQHHFVHLSKQTIGIYLIYWN